MINLPSPFSDLPFHRLGYSQPSPIHLLPGLTRHVNKGKDDTRSTWRLWAKREDQGGALACYGNKYRKFEYIIPDILAQPTLTTIVTEGALQSNHTVQVAAMAQLLGMKCTVLLHKGIGGLREAEDKISYARVGNVQMNKLLGAHVLLTDESDTGDATGPLLPILDELRAHGELPYWISSGASLHPLGGLGYARCAFEIAGQEHQLRLDKLVPAFQQFDYIFVACGSGSTLAGLIAGFKLLDKISPKTSTLPKRNIIGIMTSPTKSRMYQEERILRLAKMTAQLIGLNPNHDLTTNDIHLDDGFVGTGYGLLDNATAETIDLSMRTDALLLDPVYTAKVMSGMLHRARQNESSDLYPSLSADCGVNALFIHTGGQSALSAYSDVWPQNSTSTP